MWIVLAQVDQQKNIFFLSVSSDVVVVLSPTQNGAHSSLFAVDLKGLAQLEWGDGWVYSDNTGF